MVVVSTFAHRLDIDSDGQASVGCLHEPDDPTWFCVDDNGVVTDETCWVSTWALEWAEFAGVDGPGMVDVVWGGDHPEVVGFTPDVAE